MQDLWKLTARDSVALLRKKEVSPLEFIDAAEARIATVEPKVNALPILCLDRARERAREMMKSKPPSDSPGYLHGLPIVVKDLTAVAGVRWTDGSRVFQDRVPARSDIAVETLEKNGAIVIAKSNTPEFGAGGNTINDAFGATLNPWDTRYTCGGSSGGSATALAAGETWLATGSDMAGSVRIPASFCSIVGLRPSPGRVAHGPKSLCFSILNVDGPMARNVGDVALMFDAMIGEHPEDPVSLPHPGTSFLEALKKPKRPRRIAWSANLNIGPVDPEVRRICEAAVARFEGADTVVTEDCPDLKEANAAFYTLRNLQRVGGFGNLIETHRDVLSPEIIHYVEKGSTLTAKDIGAAERARSLIYHRVAEFFTHYDILATPTVMAPPFDVKQRHLMEVDGTKFTDYFAYLILTYAITITSCPAISVPCGFTASGLPVGLQLIGRPRGDADVLAAAAIFESMHDFAELMPIDPRVK